MTNDNTIFYVISIVTGEFTMLLLQKYGYKVCMILFGVYLTNYKVYIHLPCIKSKQLTTAPFNITHGLSSNDCKTMRL